MATQQRLAAMGLYAGLMEEAKIRFDCIDNAVRGSTGFPSPVVREFCFLQLRMLCEIIALGCLTAHGDITVKTSSKLLTEYAADKIIRSLTRLHPDFYPHPVLFNPVPESPDTIPHIHLVEKTGGFLTRRDLLNLYAKSGDHLHRGTIKKLLSTQTPIETHYADIISWTNKIVMSLDGHRISSSNNRDHWMCILSNSFDHGRVQVTLAESQQPPIR